MVRWQVQRMGRTGACSRTAVLTIEGRLDVAALAPLTLPLQRMATDADLVICDVRRLSRPDISTIDALALLGLWMRRLECALVLRGAGEDLQQLIWLAGLVRQLPSGHRPTGR